MLKLKGRSQSCLNSTFKCVREWWRAC